MPNLWFSNLWAGPDPVVWPRRRFRQVSLLTAVDFGALPWSEKSRQQLSDVSPDLRGVSGEVSGSETGRHERQGSVWLTALYFPSQLKDFACSGIFMGVPDATTPRLPTLLFFQDQQFGAAAFSVKIRASLLELPTQASQTNHSFTFKATLWSVYPLEVLLIVFTSGSRFVCILHALKDVSGAITILLVSCYTADWQLVAAMH